MATLQQQIADLRRRLASLPADARAAEITPIEAEARSMLTAAKNTPFEDEAKSLFTEIAKRSAAPAAEATQVRSMIRRARIRMDETAASDQDYDEAIDILAKALEQDTTNPDLLNLLKQAGNRSAQHESRIRDLIKRYNLTVDLSAPPAPVSYSTPLASTSYTSSNPIIANANNDPASDQSESLDSGVGAANASSTTTQSMPTTGGVDAIMAEVAQAYYAGDYQRTVDTANRVLALQPDNAAALDYRQKSEDNLIRGIVPDHRIPFDARVAYNRANSLVRAGNYEDAERLYRDARELAERAGISNWKDAEQALLEIQDLALARELLADGDRLLSGDDWSNALRKYEGAIRVVPSDPMAQERIDLVKRIQDQYDRATVQLNMMSGTLTERVTNLQAVMNSLVGLRQMLPSSARLLAMVSEAEKRMVTIKSQLIDQGRAAFTRSESATAIEEKLRLANESVKMLEIATQLDSADADAAAALQSARQAETQTSDARQLVERASALLAQNFDSELMQARSMLASLRGYGQDPRYRMIVSDLMSQFIERIEAAVDRRDIPTAERWLALAKDEPFRMLGRRSELLQLEEEIRTKQRNQTLRTGLIFGGIIGVIALLGFTTRTAWVPVVNNIVNPPTLTYTPTSTLTLTPSSTPTETYTPTWTLTSTLTPTFTSTWTPSLTSTPTFTPTETFTPSFTFTPSITPTSTDTQTFTPTPTITNTPEVKCRVVVTSSGVNVRATAAPNSAIVNIARNGTFMEVLEIRIGTDGRGYYNVRYNVQQIPITGWVRADLVQTLDVCPGF